jgi:signal peptidase I
VNLPRLLRWLYLAGFFVVLPLLGAVALVWVVAPSDGYVGVGTLGWIRSLFRDQRVPVGIVLFTILEFALWNQRHHLPWSEILLTAGRADVPPRYRGEFERAASLLEEAERIIAGNQKKIERELRSSEREELFASLDQLRKAMRDTPFDGERFEHALIRADGEVDVRLGPWRKGELREYAESIGIAVAVALLLRVFFVEAFKIPSGSMIPTLQVGDHIFVNKTAYGPLVPWTRSRLFPSLPPKRGDVMVFEFPENREQDFIKRVIAIPGDKLEVRDGHPVLNGWRVPSCAVGTYTYRESDSTQQRKADLAVEYLEDKAYLTLYERTFHTAGDVQGPYTAKPGEVWVLGDNRNNSHDSRGWFEGRGGGVPFANIKGRAMFVWLSFDSTGNMAFERILVDVMGKPKLPRELEPTLGPGIEKCFRERPPLTETTPPPPSH